MGVMQDTIRTMVLVTKQVPFAKQWWSNDLSKLKRAKNRLSSLSYRYRAVPDHPSHKQHRLIRNKYGDAIHRMKKEHWKDFLESGSYENLWIANKYISGSGSDGGKTRMPTLQISAMESSSGRPGEVVTNEEKSEVLVRLMFPRKLVGEVAPCQYDYPSSLLRGGEIMSSQVSWHIMKLSPYKAAGPDEIPNIVLKKCVDSLTPYLLQIFRSVLKLKVYIDGWCEVITCMLRKPGKPRYNVPKAYRPIVLLNTTAKLLMSIVAEEVSHLTEKHQLLPVTHFGGRPGCTTTDSLHLLTDIIKVAWRHKQVASVLFLDVEG